MREAISFDVLTSDQIVQALIEMSTYQYKDGKILEAVSTLLQVLKLEPKDYRHFVRIGVLLMKADVRDRALFFLNEALRLNPADNQILYYIARLLFVDGNLQHASELVQKCCRENPERDEYWSLLGVILAGEKMISEAYECLRQALNLNPTSLLHSLNIAGLYELNGQKIDAGYAYEEILRKFPGNEAAQRRLKVISGVSDNNVPVKLSIPELVL
eukprot:TRINITY_DN8250_c0_g1_i1.p1 TRINITY_DN8250_c0_g1~~TRINITY_DN8250_c0_g1_i1.p1  ORF type:complete len:215 (+),score=34.55 TRINITY_DN8250_c0_g1_i1:605-1249(+)